MARPRAPACAAGRVWYRARDGAEAPATVEAVDVTHPPPSFCVRLDGAGAPRETEAPRLRAMAAGEDPRATAEAGGPPPVAAHAVAVLL